MSQMFIWYSRGTVQVTKIQESTIIGKNTIWIMPFTVEKEKWGMWTGKSMDRAGIKGCHVLLTGDIKIQEDDAEKIKYTEVSAIE